MHKTLLAQETHSIRGAMRGRRVMPDLIFTRPAAVKDNKKGTTGTQQTYTANYFRLLKVPNWTIYRYHVDFSPEIDIVRIKKGVFYNATPKLSRGRIFDGK